MWRAILLHEFPDGNIRNFQAIAGSLQTANMGAQGGAAGNRDTSVSVTPGTGFSYQFAEPLAEVIGVSIRLRLRYPVQGITDPVPLVQLGDGVEIRIQPFIDPQFNRAELGAPAKGLLRLGTSEFDLGGLILPHRRFTDIRFDWHSSGQARLLQNKKLIGYQHSVATQSHFELNGIRFGLLDLPAVSNPRYQLQYVFVRAMKRADSLADFTGLLPELTAPEDPMMARCRELSTIKMIAAVEQLRAFMATFHSNFSEKWSIHNGPAGGPFKEESLHTHKQAITAMLALSTMIRKNDFSAPNDFLDPFEKFLHILHSAMPTEFDHLASELSTSLSLSPQCKSILENHFSAQVETIKPLVDLLASAADRIKTIVGGP